MPKQQQPQKLHQDSGQTDARRREEAQELVERLANATAGMDDNEIAFVEGLIARFDEFEERTLVSAKQLFWLRDLAEKYV